MESTIPKILMPDTEIPTVHQVPLSISFPIISNLPEMVVPHAVLPLLAMGAKSYQIGVYG